jgi:hypothetical protein
MRQKTLYLLNHLPSSRHQPFLSDAEHTLALCAWQAYLDSRSASEGCAGVCRFAEKTL